MCVYECRHLWKPKVSDLPGAGPTGGCELPDDVRAEKQTQVLRKSSVCSYSQSHLSRPYLKQM